MKPLNRIFILFVSFALLVVSLGITVHPADAAEPFVCLPTCSTVDGRMLTIASVGYFTLAGNTISIQVSAPKSMAAFEIDIFDGDSSGLWDAGTSHMPLTYTLFADPAITGDTSIQVAQWTGTSMADNDWTAFTISQDTRAMAPSGDYFYHLQVDLPDASTVDTVSSFKIRSDAPVEMSANRSFAYMIPLWTIAESNIIYPNGYPTAFPNNVATTFDGTWDLYFNVPAPTPSFVIWDGDMDFGTYDCSANDTHDMDTPEGTPSWTSNISVLPEGIATSSLKCINSAGMAITGPDGQMYTTGNPNEDSANPIFQRSPAVTYDVIDPNGNIYHNANPSGNQEWEQFRIDSDPNSVADYTVNGMLPAGIYHVRITGLDLRNLNAWHPVYELVSTHEDDTPTTPVLHPYLIGDTIWNDTNSDGIQNNNEIGIQGVTVSLLDANGLPIPNGTTITDANGQYTFSVIAGSYMVRVDASNFDTSGALAGYVSTTGGDMQINTVATDNVLSFDFGYHGSATIGDFIWKDANGNGIQDFAEVGLAGVTVKLLDSDGVTIIAVTTASNGNYNFADIAPGTYYVQVLPPLGYTFTSKNAAESNIANDSNVNAATGVTDAIMLIAGQVDDTIDAGMKVVIPSNYCSFIRTPGFWKNYANHMSSATFLNLISHTQDFNYLTVAQAVTILSKNNGTTNMGIPALDGVNATYLKFLLTAEINAVWNGQDNAADLGGQLGVGIYQGTNSTVNQMLHQAYLDRKKYSSSEKAYVLYLGGNGEGKSSCVCKVRAPK
ncbi:MAG: hypothetical protein HZB50_07670 [Chloroflexi bacterium]|nr:hypothetical protein [Chloroflexota bacterium]